MLDDLGDLPLQPNEDDDNNYNPQDPPPSFGPDIDRDPDLAPVIQQLETKSDLTLDKIDWKAVKDEDRRTAAQLMDKCGWQAFEEEFTGDPTWCAHEVQSVSKGINQIDPFQTMNQYVNEHFGKVDTIQLLTGIQTLYTKLVLLSGIDDELVANGTIRFWYRRRIYEHLYGHHRTNFASTHNQLEAALYIQSQLLNSHIFKTDPLTGNKKSHTFFVYVTMCVQ